ncbi:MAG: beta-phosphoglucomutase [Oscillospiraceae bacterium]|nr:beta-phosphoglucomutase [Oscillospiraceae bacterium]
MVFQAIIFDLDGVICFTDEYHYQAWKRLADELGVPFDRQKNNRLRGVSRMASLEIVLEDYTEPLAEAEKLALADQKNETYKTLLAQMSPSDLPEDVRTTLLALRERGLKLAIGSSSKNTPFILQQIGLADFFDAVSDGNNITKSKPDPEVFLKAAQMLDVAPECCLVVEDAVAGAEAAHRGNMRAACVGDAAKAAAGDYNLSSITELLSII